MRIAVAGAGAVGCHYGSMLMQGGHEVVFLARGDHLLAMQEKGLRHVSNGKELLLKVRAEGDVSLLSEAEVVLLACKMTDLDAMLHAMRPHVPDTALLVTMQNGVQAPDWAARVFPRHAVAAATAFIGARIESPGMVVHSAHGGMRLGMWQAGAGEKHIQPLLVALRASGVPARGETKVRTMLWRKLLWNVGFNAITAITRRHAKNVAADSESLAVVQAAMREAVAVAHAEDIELGEEDIAKHVKVTLAMGPVKTSMWQDIERGKKTEVDFINGFIASRAGALGLAAPVNAVLTVLVHGIEGRTLSASVNKAR